MKITNSLPGHMQQSATAFSILQPLWKCTPALWDLGPFLLACSNLCFIFPTKNPHIF